MKLLAAVFIPLSLAAQSLVDDARIDAVRRTFELADHSPRLNCKIEPIQPTLDFSLRYQTGYAVSVPLNQYEGQRHYWAILTRVIPEGGGVRYLMERNDLPDVPRKAHRADGQVVGAFAVGEGGYSIETIVEDDLGRACSRNWTLRVKREPGVELALPPGSVAPLWPEVKTAQYDAPNESSPLTVMVHAAPLSSRLAKLDAGDVAMLSGCLSALMEQLRRPSVRLVIFSLSQRSILYEDDDFTPDKFDRAVQTFNQPQLDVIDVKTLEDSRGPLEILDGYWRNQLARSPAPGDVVFLGPYTPPDSVSFEPYIQPPPGPHVFYVEYRASATYVPPRLPRAGGEDSFGSPLGPPDDVDRFVGLLKGESMAIYTPRDFAEAVRRIEAALAR